MKIEKLSNNKLKVIFTINELEKDNIDYQSFMSGSTKCENILANLLYIAKNELDFDTKNCNIEVQTYEVTHGNFIITITKFEKIKKKLKVKRKQRNLEKNNSIFEFENCNNYFDFLRFLDKNFPNIYNILIKNSQQYKFQNKQILIVSGAHFSNTELQIFNYVIAEFGTFYSDSETLITKIKECNLNCTP